MQSHATQNIPHQEKGRELGGNSGAPLKEKNFTGKKISNSHALCLPTDLLL